MVHQNKIPREFAVCDVTTSLSLLPECQCSKGLRLTINTSFYFGFNTYFADNHLLLTHGYDQVGDRVDVLHCFNHDTCYDHQSHLMRSLWTILSFVLRQLDFSRCCLFHNTNRTHSNGMLMKYHEYEKCFTKLFCMSHNYRGRCSVKYVNM